jgi:hypothetical protein
MDLKKELQYRLVGFHYFGLKEVPKDALRKELIGDRNRHPTNVDKRLFRSLETGLQTAPNQGKKLPG